MANAQHFILATAGHVDHGKSALIKALTGTDPDRLPEEKARGITIDLGFAHLDLPGADGLTYRLGIVDVPGHEDFVKNMVAGVGSIDLALFIVAADDGWMPQSEEHLQILSYLGIKQAVVALTKDDLLDSDVERETAIQRIREQLQNSPFAGAEIVPTSVPNDTGIDALREALVRALAKTPPPRDFGKPRLPVDRVFTLKGIGTVVTGTLTGWVMRRGQTVVVQPSGLGTRLRTLQSHNQETEVSFPGTRTALNLPDIASHADTGARGVSRGDTVSLPECWLPSRILDVVLEKTARLVGLKGGAARPVTDGLPVKVQHGSGTVPAKIALAESGRLVPGERAIAQLRCDRPLFAFAGDHFIVRDWSEQCTLAGGVVLDPDAARDGIRTPRRRQLLQSLVEAGGAAGPFVAAHLEREGAVRRAGLLVQSRFGESDVDAAVAGLVQSQDAVVIREWVVQAARWRQVREQALETIDAEHRLRPHTLGLSLSELRRVLARRLPAPELFDLMVTDLCRESCVQSGTTIRRTSHRLELPAELQAAGVTLRGALSAKPSEPPSRKELTPDRMAQQALRFLLETGEAVEISPEVVLLAEAYARAVGDIRRFLRVHGSATVSELRQAVGASRRIVIPLLEKLDREGVTRREGDKRMIR